MVQFDEEKQNRKLGFLRDEEEEELAKMLSAKYRIPYIDLSLVSINSDGLQLIKEADARKANVAVFNLIDKKAFVGTLAPNSDAAVDQIKDLEERGYVPQLFIVSEKSLQRAWDRYKDLSHTSETKGGVLEVANADIAELTKEVSSVKKIQETINDLVSTKKSFKISRVVEVLLAGALATGASDVHMEPEEMYVRLRLRLNGVLTDILKLTPDTYHLIVSRIKLLSGLKLNIKDAAQDGRFSIKMGEEDIEIRTSTVPGAYGESIVMRVLNPETISVPMEQLGMEPELLGIMNREISKPNGMILNTGPTGSGKTTTLYAFLKKVQSPDIKILTIEDPVEYHLEGVVQTQTDPEKGYTFALGLRAALRQDPDVIMVGEIRDGETADIAVNSALTGHLVFSTLHTNNAAGAFPRLANLGVNPTIMSSAITVTMAQRLVRKLCEQCKKAVPLEGTNKAMLEKVIATVPDKSKITQTAQRWEAAGCDVCSGTGYKGRLGIFEVILMTPEIDQVIKMGGSEREIQVAARTQLIPTMQEDAVIKILRGITSIDEVLRVIDLTNEA